MNIFYLHENPMIAAQHHCDKHVVKMILETALMLSTAHRVLDNVETDNIYKLTHKNHPSSKWVRESSENYKWSYELFIGLLNEYTFRYNKTHKSSRLIEYLKYIPKNISNKKFIEPPLAMPDEYKSNSAIESYRKYYNKEKLHFARWTKRNKPTWINLTKNQENQ